MSCIWTRCEVRKSTYLARHLPNLLAHSFVSYICNHNTLLLIIPPFSGIVFETASKKEQPKRYKDELSCPMTRAQVYLLESASVVVWSLRRGDLHPWDSFSLHSFRCFSTSAHFHLAPRLMPIFSS